MLPYIRDRQTQNSADMKGKLREVLRNHRNHTGIMRARRQLTEKHVLAFYKKFNTVNSAAAQRTDHFFRNFLRVRECLFAHRVRLP